MAVIPHGVGAETIPCDAAHAFLVANSGLGGGRRIPEAEGVAIAQRWHTWFVTKAAPHVVELDAEGHIVQLYKHFYYGEPCCAVVAPRRRPRGSPRRALAREETR